MKVISGTLKGKQLKGFDIEGTRPTQDRVKESLFGMIQNYVSDATVLDLFAGSGSLGIEALSNGASYTYFVDLNKKACSTIEENLKNTNLSNYKILNSDYMQALKNFASSKTQFDIIFLDPPYKLECMDQILKFIVEEDLLTSSGIVVCEAEFDTFKENYSGLTQIKYKKYGYKFIKVFEKD